MNLLPHQAPILADTWQKIAWGLFLDPGLGKTRIAIATARKLQAQKAIDGVLLIAPNMIHRSWIVDELPKCDDQWDYAAYVYNASTAGTAREKTAYAKLLNAEGKMRWLSMTYDALMTEAGKKIATEFLTAGSRLLIFDESSRLKNPKAQRTKACLKLSKLAAFIRILNGTPISNTPLDLYSQIAVLAANFWSSKGFGSYTAWRNQFAVLRKVQIHRAGRLISFDNVVGYRNLDQLAAYVSEISTKLAKKDVLALPPVTYTTRSFELGPAQRNQYDTLLNTCMLQLNKGLVTVQQAITMLMRLQQIASGFVSVDGIPTALRENARLDLLSELCVDRADQAIIYAKFDWSSEAIKYLLGDSAERLDGNTAQKRRLEIVDQFQKGNLQYLISRPKVGGLGLNLQSASQIYHFESEWSIGDRIQAEDRIIRIGQERSCNITTLVATNTIDDKIAAALARKREWSIMSLLQNVLCCGSAK